MPLKINQVASMIYYHHIDIVCITLDIDTHHFGVALQLDWCAKGARFSGRCVEDQPSEIDNLSPWHRYHSP